MTREDEIEKQARLYTLAVFDDLDDFSDVTAAYIDGARWADENPYSNGKELLYVAQKTAERTKKEVIINACDWLDNINTDNYMDSGIFQMSDLISDFKRAMKDMI